MRLLDANILVYAHREDAPGHEQLHAWMLDLLDGDEPFGLTGARHWQLFKELCQRADARGNLVTDAHLAALAVETGSELVTTDRDFARFPGVRATHPLN